MEHWSEKYLGLSYRSGEFDCADLVRRVLREQCEIDIPLPSERTWRGRDPKDLAAFGSTFAVPTDIPGEYDFALMKLQGNRVSLGSHIGVTSIVNGLPWVLHSMKRVGVVFCPVSNLGLFRLELVGYYRWRY